MRIHPSWTDPGYWAVIAKLARWERLKAGRAAYRLLTLSPDRRKAVPPG